MEAAAHGLAETSLQHLGGEGRHVADRRAAERPQLRERLRARRPTVAAPGGAPGTRPRGPGRRRPGRRASRGRWRSWRRTSRARRRRTRSGPIAARTSSLSAARARAPAPNRRRLAVTSRNASSMPRGSTRSVNRSNTSNTCRDTCPYSFPRGGRKMAWGQRRHACEIGCAEWIAVLSGLVVGRRHDAPPFAAPRIGADHHRLATQRRDPRAPRPPRRTRPCRRGGWCGDRSCSEQ